MKWSVILSILVFNILNIDPFAGAEEFLPVHNSRDCYSPSVGCAKDVYFIAWQSGRIGPGDIRKGVKYIGDIVGCRVQKNGDILDQQPIVISDNKDLQSHVKVASNGDFFLIVWQDLRNGKDWDIYAARVTRGGMVLDKGGFLVSGGQHNQAKPCATWDGKTFIVAWQDFRSSKWYEIYGSRISMEGDVLDPEGIKISVDNPHSSYSPAIDSTGNGESFVVWVQQGLPSESHRISGCAGAFLNHGRLNDNNRFYSDIKERHDHGPSGRAHPISLSAGSQTFLTAWKTYGHFSRARAPNKSHLAVFSGSGNIIKYNKFIPKNKNQDRYIINPSTCWDGSNYIVSWHEFVANKKNEYPHDEVYFAVIGETGSIIGNVNHLSGKFGNPASNSSVASNQQGNALCVYEYHPRRSDTPIKIAYQYLSLHSK